MHNVTYYLRASPAPIDDARVCSLLTFKKLIDQLMPNEVEFIVPVNPNLPLDFSLNPSLFRAQFMPMVPPSAPLPSPLLNHPQILADVLDSGYGSNASPMPSLSTDARKALEVHLRAQLNLTLTLLSQPHPPGGDWMLQSFVSTIEKTAKSADSFLLGMLYARVATRLWGQARGLGNIQEFWHYGVLVNTASHFMAEVAYKEENPDFLVKFDTGTWACVEAKGSFSNVDNADLKKGLSQACKLTEVRWQRAGASSPTTVFPTEQACAMTFFAPPSNTLQVVLMDPPRAVAEDTPASLKTPLLFKEGGDFVRWAQASAQYRDIASEGFADLTSVDDSFASRFFWAPFPGQTDLWVGIPTILNGHIPQLNAALVILGWLVPYLSHWRARPSRTIRGVNQRLLNMARYAEARARDAEARARDAEDAVALPGELLHLATMWRGLAQFLNDYRSNNREIFEWTGVLRGIWSCDLYGHLDKAPQERRKQRGTLELMWDNLNRNERIERRLSRRLIDLENGDALGASFARTTHGLVVAKANIDWWNKLLSSPQTRWRTPQ